MRGYWIAASAILCLIAGFFAWNNTAFMLKAVTDPTIHRLIDAQADILALPFALMISGILFCLLGLVLPYAIDVSATSRVNSDLTDLTASSRRKPVTPRDLLKAMAASPAYEAALRRLIDIPTPLSPRLRTARAKTDTKADTAKDAEDTIPLPPFPARASLISTFSDREFAIGPLHLPVFVLVSWLILTTAVLNSSLDLALGGAADLAAFGLTLGLPLATVFLIQGLVRFTRDSRAAQMANLRQKLAHFVATPDPVRDQQIILEQITSLSGSIGQLEGAIGGGAEKTATATAAAITASLEKPLARLSEQADRNAQFQTEQMEKLVRETMKSFSSAMESQLAADLKKLADLLTTAAKSAAAAEKSFTTATNDISKASKDAAQAIHTASAKEIKAITKGFDTGLKDLASQMDKQVRAMEKAMAASATSIQKATETSLGETSRQLATASGNLDSLHDSIESLNSLVTPVLRQIMETQKTVQAAIENENSATQVIGKAAGELSAAAQAGRETVEQFITLAEKMREVSRGIRDQRSDVPMRRAQPAGDRSPSRRRLQEAMADLRESANVSLPDLD